MRISVTTIMAIILAMAFFCGCNTTKKMPPGYINISANPEDATIIIDGKKRGNASEFSAKEDALKLESGAHKVEIIKDGYYSYSREITIGSDSTESISADLNKIHKNN